MTKWCPQHGYPLPCDKCGMNWEDTVMHLDDIDEGRMPDSYSSQRKALEKQAGISYQAGYKEGKNVGMEKGFQAGIKEVMDWINQDSNTLEIEVGGGIVRIIDRYAWQAKLKDWGI